MTQLYGLYGITDSELLPNDETLLDSVQKALEGGMRILQYRDKSSDTTRRLRQAKALVALCHQHNAVLLINDDVELAKLSGADGVHLGQGDGSPSQARAALGAQAIIGVTCHDQLELAQEAAAQGADYVAVGAFFPSKTKPNAKPAPLELLHTAQQEINAPVVAIGGITVDNAHQVIDAGAQMIAVVHALFAAADITAQARAFNQTFNRIED